MAELRMTGRAVRLQLLPGGQVGVEVLVPVQLPDGHIIQATDMLFVLTDAERAEWKAALGGLVVANGMVMQ